jgi:hypothetical protein
MNTYRSLTRRRFLGASATGASLSRYGSTAMDGALLLMSPTLIVGAL